MCIIYYTVEEEETEPFGYRELLPRAESDRVEIRVVRLGGLFVKVFLCSENVFRVKELEDALRRNGVEPRFTRLCAFARRFILFFGGIMDSAKKVNTKSTAQILAKRAARGAKKIKKEI